MGGGSPRATRSRRSRVNASKVSWAVPPNSNGGDGPVARDPVDVAERVLEGTRLVGVELGVAEGARERGDLEEVRPGPAVEGDRAEGQRVEPGRAGLVGRHRRRPADGREVVGEGLASGLRLGIGGGRALHQPDQLGRPEAEAEAALALRREGHHPADEGQGGVEIAVHGGGRLIGRREEVVEGEVARAVVVPVFVVDRGLGGEHGLHSIGFVRRRRGRSRPVEQPQRGSVAAQELGDEGRRLLVDRRAAVGRQDQPVLGAGHRDVQEPALLVGVDVAGRDGLAQELGREEPGAVLARRPLPFEQAGDEDDRELEPLRLVQRHQPDALDVLGQLDARRQLAAGLR